MKIILFSGGVESTALLTLADPATTATLTFSNFTTVLETYNKNNYEKIFNYFNLQNFVMQLNIPRISWLNNEHLSTRHMGFMQPIAFISAAVLLVHTHPEISEIWYGQNSSEPTNQNGGLFKKYLPVFESIHPNTKWKFPLNHLSKVEQWNMIPEDIKPFVSSCAYHTNCGMCTKCGELRKSGIVLPK